MMLQTMKAFKHLMNAYEVKHVIACATSAMRDAKNSDDIIRKVKLETDISIEVISGDKEAGIVFENQITVHTSGGKDMLTRAADTVSNWCEQYQRVPPQLLGVTILTSMDALNLRQIGMNEVVEEQVLRLATPAKETSKGKSHDQQMA